MLYGGTVPVMTVSMVSPVVDSRPRFTWVTTLGTGRTQAGYRFRVFSDAEALKPGFDPRPEFGFTALWDSQFEFSGTAYSDRVEADLPSSGTYRLYGVVRDDLGMESAWSLLKTFTTSFTPPPAPLVTMTMFPDDGYVQLKAQSTYNLLDADTSSFDNGLGTWGATVINCVAEWDSVGQRMKLNFTGATYAQLDTAFATYTAEDTALTTHAASAAYRGGFTMSQIQTARALQGIPVVAATVYSAVASIQPLNRQITARLDIAWFTGTGLTNGASLGAAITCPLGTATNVYIDNATAPAGSAFASIGITVDDPYSVIGEAMYMDRVAFASTATTVWTPGGQNDGLGFVIQRSVNNEDWEYVWGASHDSPAGVSGQGADRVVINDRALPLGQINLQYRAFAVTKATTAPIYSLPTVVSDPNGLMTPKWFIRCPSDPDCDMRVFVDEWSWSEDTYAEMIFPTGKDLPVAFTRDLPKDREARLSFILKTEQERLHFQEIMDLKETVFLQQNVGRGAYIRPTGKINWGQRRSAGLNGLPNDVHTVSFAAQVMA